MRPREKKSRLLDKANKGLMLSLKAVDMMRKTPEEGRGSWQNACRELEAEHVKRLENAKLWTEKQREETTGQSTEEKPV